MIITKSAKKALRQNEKRRIWNIRKKKNIKKALGGIEKLIALKKIKEAKLLLPRAYKLLDKAAKIGLIKKNTATRKKSRITQLVNRNS